MCTIEKAKEKWNKVADEHNQWDSLSLEERLELCIAEIPTKAAEEVLK